LLVQDTLVDELTDLRARLEGGVEGDPRLWPEQPAHKVLLHTARDSLVANVDEAADVLGVVIDQPVAQVEDVHEILRGFRLAAVFSRSRNSSVSERRQTRPPASSATDSGRCPRCA